MWYIPYQNCTEISAGEPTKNAQIRFSAKFICRFGQNPNICDASKTSTWTLLHCRKTSRRRISFLLNVTKNLSISVNFDKFLLQITSEYRPMLFKVSYFFHFKSRGLEEVPLHDLNNYNTKLHDPAEIVRFFFTKVRLRIESKRFGRPLPYQWHFTKIFKVLLDTKSYKSESKRKKEHWIRLIWSIAI